MARKSPPSFSKLRSRTEVGWTGIFKGYGLVSFRMEKIFLSRKEGWDILPTLESYNMETYYRKSIEMMVLWVTDSENVIRFLIQPRFAPDI